MGKKVLIINSSPRKTGNCAVLCKEFARGAEEAGHSVETVALREKKVAPCLACMACQKNGGTCVQKDDMAAVLDSIAAADVIVLATPVYFFSVTAQLKAMIDRTFARYTAIKEKTFYCFMTSGSPAGVVAEAAHATMKGYITCLAGSTEAGCIHAGGFNVPGEVAGTDFAKEAYEMGKNA